MSDQTIARAHHVNRNTVVHCINKCLRFGVEAALGELPRTGRPRRLSDAAVAWVLDCACRKPKKLGYSYELGTYQRLVEHIRRQGVEAEYPELARLSRSKLHKVLTQAALRPHKILYYVERRDPDFEQKMAAILHVYKEVEITNGERVSGRLQESPMVTLSYDETPGIQALAATAPDRPPVPGRHAHFQRDYEYKRLDTVSLLAGLDLRGTRVASKQELIERVHRYFEELNADRVIFHWKYKMDETIID
jgi:transposase